MRTSAERKETARQFLKEHANTGPKTKARVLRNDDQDKIIPQRDRKGWGRLPAFSKPIFPDIRMSSGFSADLTKSVFPSFPRNQAANDAVSDITADYIGIPVILDTNVVVEGLFSLRIGSPSKQLMELALADSEEIVPCVTTAIIYEYKRILEKFGDDRLEHLYRLLFRAIEIPVLPDIEIPQVETDPSDTPFVEALVLTMRGLTDGGRPAPKLVTWDHHLLNMATAEDLPESLRGRIVTPADLLRELKR